MTASRDSGIRQEYVLARTTGIAARRRPHVLSVWPYHGKTSERAYEPARWSIFGSEIGFDLSRLWRQKVDRLERQPLVRLIG